MTRPISIHSPPPSADTARRGTSHPEPGQPLPRAGAHHPHPARRPAHLRHPGELHADASGHRQQHRDGDDSRPALHRQMAAPGECLHHGDQCRHPDPLAGLLAVRPVQPDLDHVEVRDPLAWPAPLEPLEPGRQRDALPRPRHGRQPEHPVGQRALAHARHLGSWAR